MIGSNVGPINKSLPRKHITIRAALDNLYPLFSRKVIERCISHYAAPAGRAYQLKTNVYQCASTDARAEIAPPQISASASRH